MISIAMTTYNGEKYVIKQLNSIVNQTRKPDEVIIVDDCSTDNTLQLVSHFILSNKLNSNWKLITHDENKGYIQSFHDAIEKVSGNIIFLCDHDDIWVSDKIENMSRLMIENQEIVALASKFRKIDSEDNLISARVSPLYSNNNLIRKRLKQDSCEQISIQEILCRNISPGCTSAFRADIKEYFLMFNSCNNTLPHDWAINIIAALKNGLYFVNKTTTEYRLHDSNAIGIQTPAHLQDREKSLLTIQNQQISMKSLIELLSDFSYFEEKDTKCSLRYITKLIQITETRINNISEKKVGNSIKLLSNQQVVSNRLMDSVVLDTLLILKDKLNLN